MTSDHKQFLQACFVLHTRAYRDTSLLVEVFSREEGLFSAIAKGVRQTKLPQKGLLQPFTPLWLNWFGRHELVTLKNIEARALPYQLNQQNLLSGLYLNELLLKVLTKHDPHPPLFSVYENTLQQLANNDVTEICLRQFELQLLAELGYGLILNRVADSHELVDANFYYDFHPEQGIVKAAAQDVEREHLFSGAVLLGITSQNWQDKQVLTAAKRILRRAISHLIGHQTLKTRALFNIKN